MALPLLPALQKQFSALMHACHAGHLHVAQWLVEHAGSDARTDRNHVSTASVHLLQALWCIPLTMWSTSMQDGASPLLMACYLGHVDVARWLVAAAGSNPLTERNGVRVVRDACDRDRGSGGRRRGRRRGRRVVMGV